MQSDFLASLRRLSDDELVTRVKDLVCSERVRMVEVVAHLAELDTRDLHFRAGHGSLFAYCRDVLGLSEQEAYNRITVARAARRYPVVLQMLEDGSLNLTAARLLVPHLTADNHVGVLENARWKTKAQVEELAAALWPRPDAPSFVRKLPPPRPAVDPHSALSSGDVAASPSPPASSSDAGAPYPPWPTAARPAEVTPLAPDRYKVQVTIGGETLEKLRLAKDLLRHAVPSGDEAVIFDRALTALLSDLAQKKFAASERPRPAPPPRPGSRTIPAELKRRVWLRDLGCCAFVAATGRRCTERAFLEFHHVEPYALGGEATLANIQLRCRSHNAYEARLWFDNGHGNGAGSVREERAPYGGATRSGTSGLTEWSPGPAG
ncbi:MAG TPA: HNH endonuclease signature motif containing protein [Vicinamibacteria bacterium]|jgi:hypothetical protein